MTFCYSYVSIIRILNRVLERRSFKCPIPNVTDGGRGIVGIQKDDPKDQVIAKAKEVIADKLTGNIIKEIYVPGRLVNIVMK